MANERIYQYAPLWGNWNIESLIGKGSFGSVYKVYRDEMGHRYYAAVKIISIPTSEQYKQAANTLDHDESSINDYFEDMVKNIVNEIKMLFSLSGNSNIINYQDHQVIKRSDEFGWDILIRMEFLTSLPDYLKQHHVTRGKVIKLGLDICSALEICSKKGIIHRDIKEENIFANDDHVFKLGDFGIAKELSEGSRAASMRGTPLYMAPEIYHGERYDASVDIYSLGMVLYKLLNHGRLPFMPPFPEPIRYKNSESAIEKRLDGTKMPLPDQAGEILGSAILKACEFDSKNRYSTIEDFKHGLEESLKNLTNDEKSEVLSSPKVSENNAKPSNLNNNLDRSADRLDETSFAFKSSRDLNITESAINLKSAESKGKGEKGNFVETKKQYPVTSNLTKGTNGQPYRFKKYPLKAIFSVLITMAVVGIGALLIFQFTNSQDKVSDTQNALSSDKFETSSDELLSISTQSSSKSTESSSSNIVTLAQATTGDIVLFGEYEQDNNKANGKEDIAWKVLAVVDGKVLLLSEKNLDCQPYHENRDYITWDTCSLQTWLNSSFINEAFVTNDQDKIVETDLKNDQSKLNKTSSNKPQSNKIFLLSIEEVFQYFTNDTERTSINTPYASAKGAIEKNGRGYWWLRSGGGYSDFAAVVLGSGKVYRSGDYVDCDIYAVRPAMWINLES